jgi:hypothetical protein
VARPRRCAWQANPLPELTCSFRIAFHNFPYLKPAYIPILFHAVISTQTCLILTSETLQYYREWRRIIKVRTVPPRQCDWQRRAAPTGLSLHSGMASSPRPRPAPVSKRPLPGYAPRQSTLSRLRNRGCRRGCTLTAVESSKFLRSADGQECARGRQRADRASQRLGYRRQAYHDNVLRITALRSRSLKVSMNGFEIGNGLIVDSVVRGFVCGQPHSPTVITTG